MIWATDKCMRQICIRGIRVKILGVVDWSQDSNQPLQLESVAARVLKLFQASSSCYNVLW